MGQSMKYMTDKQTYVAIGVQVIWNDPNSELVLTGKAIGFNPPRMLGGCRFAARVAIQWDEKCRHHGNPNNVWVNASDTYTVDWMPLMAWIMSQE